MKTEGTVHYAPGDWPLYRDESLRAACTDAPRLVADCEGCLELAADGGPERPQHLRRPLSALRGDDQRPRQCGLAQSDPPAVPPL